MLQRLLTIPPHFQTHHKAELKKIALLSTFLPIWQFDHFHAVDRDVEQDYSSTGICFQFVSQKNGQNSVIISPELHELWWMDSWEEPRFESLTFYQGPTPKTYHLDAFDDQGWFTWKQWALIAPLLPQTPPKKACGRPTASSHAVISAIFYKVALHCSWEQLGARFPPARTCRRYYKRWLLSGRLMTIIQVLIDDLLKRGRIHPYDFVLEGYFRISEDFRICTIPGVCPDTWQTRLALFLMQLSYTSLRRLRREENDYYFPQKSILKKLAAQYLKVHRDRPRTRPGP